MLVVSWWHWNWKMISCIKKLFLWWRRSKYFNYSLSSSFLFSGFGQWDAKYFFGPLILVKNFELSFSLFNCNRLTITHHSPTYLVRYGAIVFLQILCVESVDTSTGTNMYCLHTSECSSLAYMTLTGSLKSPTSLMLKVYGDVEC